MRFIDRLEQSTLEEALSLLSNRFSTNRTFFQKNFPDLFNFIETPLKEYELNISETGINIIHKKSGDFVYPLVDGKTSLFRHGKSVAETPTNNRAWSRHINEALIEEKDIGRVPFTGKLVKDLKNICEKDPDYERGLIHYSGAKQLPTICLYGILSGVHIEYLLESSDKIHGALIYEPNPELFVLSTYFLDYAKLYQKCNQNSCYIVIKGRLPAEVVKNFFGTRLITNSYFRLEHSEYEHPLITDGRMLVDEIAKTGVRGWGTYEDESVGVKNKLSWLDPRNPEHPFLSKELQEEFPICVVGNGPSLNTSLEFIKNNRDSMIVFSSGTALAPLRKAGIRPDFHIEIERMDHVQKWLEDSGLDDIPLIAADVIHNSTLSCSKESYIFIRTSTSAQEIYKPKFTLDYTSPLVGNSAFALAHNFSKNIYIVGMDLGFKKEGKQHAKGSLYDEMDDQSKEMLPTRGNLSQNIYTNSLYSLSKTTIEQLLRKKSANVYNLSDGIYIDGTTPFKDLNAKLPTIDKEACKEKIKTAFTKKGVFQSQKNEYTDILKAYKKDMINLFRSVDINDKEKLFNLIDLAYYGTTIQRRAEPVTGTLLSGTFWHTINTVFVMLLRINRDDVDELHKELIDKIEVSLEDFVIE